MHIHIELSVDPLQEISTDGKLFLIISGDKRLEGKWPIRRKAGNGWCFETEAPGNRSFSIKYHYLWQKEGRINIPEENRNRLWRWRPGMPETCYLLDHWNDPSDPQNAFLKSPFLKAFLQDKQVKNPKRQIETKTAFTHEVSVLAPLLDPGKAICLLGNRRPLAHWDVSHPVIMQREGIKWLTHLNLEGEEDGWVEYKYGLYDKATGEFVCYEEGQNRNFILQKEKSSCSFISDNFCRFATEPWHGGGVSVPVFSLRSKESLGIGEFTDLKALADWAEGVGLKMIQILPVNDTSATKTWRDSYPYAAISAFALNPVYINVKKVGLLPAGHLLEKRYNKIKERLNLLPELDYGSILDFKWEYVKALYKIRKKSFWKDKRFHTFFNQNKGWLLPYAVFCFLRDKFGTADYAQFGDLSVFDEEKVRYFAGEEQPWFDQIAIYYFVQFHLHLQLSEAVKYAHKKGVALKGDIPIGIYRYSVDAWMFPEQFFLDMQAGAPPDGFAVKGQNWRFPTYNWDVMASDGFRWWKDRLKQLSLYFDAIRFDHILGFFRIWQIPSDQIEGIMGHFCPSKPFSVREIRDRGILFEISRFCDPLITAHLIEEYFGQDALEIKRIFFEKKDELCYRIKAAFSTQKQIYLFFKEQEETGQALPGYWKQALFDLLSNVLFFPADREGTLFYPRFGMMETYSFLKLPEEQQERLQQLHDDYFYRRHEKLWQDEALRKLPLLKQNTNLLVCGEDLGMMPHSVPETMQMLGLLSLEVQRMPKQWGCEFMNVNNAPYLSVMTTGTHDMNTLRSWWEEDRSRTQRFYNEIMHHHGAAPYFCEPWIVKEIIMQHFQSDAMLAIIPLQDLLGMSGAVRRENPRDERINIPADPEHYWRYRMHIPLEQLMLNEELNGMIRTMIFTSRRNS